MKKLIGILVALIAFATQPAPETRSQVIIPFTVEVTTTVTEYESSAGLRLIVVTRTYIVMDSAGNIVDSWTETTMVLQPIENAHAE